MKKLIISGLLGVIFSLHANCNEPIRFGLVGGINISNYSSPIITSKTGLHFGGVLQINMPKVNDAMFTELSLILSSKGGKSDWGGAGKVTFNPLYLELPIRMGYKYSISRDVKIIGKAGPYFAIGISGKSTATDSLPSWWTNNEDQDLFSGDNPIFKRFDAGIGLGVGVEIHNNVQIFISNDWGITRVEKNNEDSLTTGMKTGNLSFSIYYKLN
ncbi:MAG: hypothetical protein CL663_08020 [Bacteroidetes bacterium]|nr:hypothetical protein [Bacteroidota bacterium]